MAIGSQMCFFQTNTSSTSGLWHGLVVLKLVVPTAIPLPTSQPAFAGFWQVPFLDLVGVYLLIHVFHYSGELGDSQDVCCL